MKKSFGFGKKNLYLGIAFLVVVVLLWFFVFSMAKEGFYDTISVTTRGTICVSSNSTNDTSRCSSNANYSSCTSNSSCKWV